MWIVQAQGASLRKTCLAIFAHKIEFMGDFATEPYVGQDVPDPYYTRDFDTTLDMLENAIAGLATHLQTQIGCLRPNIGISLLL